jgi:MFS transporter, DHA2 family, multidrug resistance protein
MPHPADTGAVKADKLGILLLGIGLITLQIVLSRGDIDGWFQSPMIQLLSWIGAFALILFVAWEISPLNSAPLLRLELVRNRNVQAAIVLGSFAGVILSGSL